MLLAGVNHEHGRGQLLHFLDTAKVLFKLLLLGLELDNFLLGQQIEVAVGFHLLDLAQLVDAALNGLEVGQHAAQPTLVDIEHFAALGFLLDGFLGLLLGAYEQHGAAFHGQIADEVISLIDLLNGLLQVNNVDAVALGEDVFLHLRVPTTGLVAKMHTGFKQLLHGNNRHKKTSSFFILPMHHPVTRPDSSGTSLTVRMGA